MPGESTTNPCFCVPAPGTVAPSLAPYVVSLNNLYGLVTIAPGGGVSVEAQGNSIIISADGTAGLGTVTSINATSSNNNLVVTGGPVTTTGTFAFSLAGALNSLSALVTAADKMPYTTASNTYATTDLTAFARTLLDDANSTAARSTLGLVIGTNVQAWSSDLDAFVTNASWSGSDLTLAGDINAADAGFSGTLGVTGAVTFASSLSVSSVSAGTFSGSGASITGLNASNISSGTLAVARGGTNIASYAVGDLIYASGATTLAKLADVAAGSYLRSGGVTTAPVWSTLTLPNTATTGDLFYASGSDVMGRLADVALGNVLRSGGVGAAPVWGQVTSSHVNNTIATISGGVNSDITTFSQPMTFSDIAGFNGDITINAKIFDASSSEGAAGDILTSTGSTVAWSNQITLDTLTINTALNTEGTITGSGTTGNQTINKLSGTVRIAAAGTSVIVTNNLCSTSSRVLACCSTNDATAAVKNVVTTTGSFTINITATTAEVEISWLLINLT